MSGHHLVMETKGAGAEALALAQELVSRTRRLAREAESPTQEGTRLADQLTAMQERAVEVCNRLLELGVDIGEIDYDYGVVTDLIAKDPDSPESSEARRILGDVDIGFGDAIVAAYERLEEFL